MKKRWLLLPAAALLLAGLSLPLLPQRAASPAGPSPTPPAAAEVLPLFLSEAGEAPPEETGERVLSPAPTDLPPLEMTAPPTPAPEETAGGPEEGEYAYVGSRNSDKYHVPSCRYVSSIKEENLVGWAGRAEAEAAGYVPCKVCKP